MVKIFFDLEGPISPQDNAYEVLGLARNGERVFEVISKYDDILTLEGRENYEPGDTLKLIVPFLIHNKISECDIRDVSKEAGIVPGVGDVILNLQKVGWDVYIISTSYEQHAHNIAYQVGVDTERVACTKMPLDDYHLQFGDEDMEVVGEAEEKILNELYPGDDEQKVKAGLDEFFFGKLQESRLGEIFNEVTVCGGARKVDAMMKFAGESDLRRAVAVGDSITDFKMLETIKEKGGLAIAFNGNEYSIPYADIALATVDQRFLLPILKAFEEGGREGAIEATRLLGDAAPSEILEAMPSEAASTIPEDIKPPAYHIIKESDTDEIIKIHKEYRTLVRGAAGKLG
jgi:energy-converting hydrogenase A subunit R